MVNENGRNDYINNLKNIDPDLALFASRIFGLYDMAKERIEEVNKHLEDVKQTEIRHSSTLKNELAKQGQLLDKLRAKSDSAQADIVTLKNTWGDLTMQYSRNRLTIYHWLGIVSISVSLLFGVYQSYFQTKANAASLVELRQTVDSVNETLNTLSNKQTRIETNQLNQERRLNKIESKQEQKG